MRVKLDKVCKRIYAGGDVPKDRYSTVKTAEYAIPIYANAEKYNGLYGYTDTARENELSITVAARGTIGFTAIRREPFLPVVRLITVVPDLSTVSERYLYYALRNCKPAFSGTSIPQLTVPDIKKNEIELYSLSVQKTIADKLDAVGRIIELRQQQLQKLDEFVKARFVELFGDKTKFKNEPLRKNVEEMFIGPFGSALKNECFVDKDNAYCMVYEQKHAIRKTLDVPTRYVNTEKYTELKRFTVQGGDIIVSCRGTIGEIYSVPENAPLGIMHPSIMKIRLKKSKYCNLFFVIMLEQYMRESINKANGSGVKMAVTATELGEEVFIVPEISLQLDFEQFVHQVDKSKVAVQKSLDEAQLLFNSLMQKYFS